MRVAVDYSGAGSSTIVVSNQEELDAAYKELSEGGGGEILLAAGADYNLIIRDIGDEVEAAAVTIGSLDSDDPAVISKVQMIGAENIIVENLKFEASGADSEDMVALFDIRDSQDITIRNSEMASDAEGPLGTTDGHAEGAELSVVRRSDGITFEGNTISNFNQGLVFLDSENIQVLQNDMQGMQGDGIRIGGVSGMLIEGNHLHDFLGSTTDANHADMIQIWGTNTSVPNENITIRENFLDTGNGASYQMIFGRNSEYSENGELFENITIEHNVLFGAHFHAISLQHTLNAVVRNNTVIYNPDAYSVEKDGSEVVTGMSGVIQIIGDGTLITNNVAHTVYGGSGNTILDTASPLLSDDYRNHFINVEAGGDGDLRDLMLRPDSPLNGVAGSSLTWSSETAEVLTAVADVTISATDKSLVLLDASWSRGPDGYVAPLGASFLWTFADGSTASGARVVHDFGTAGSHGYVLTVTMPDGSSDTISRSLEISPVVIADLDFASGVPVDSGEGAATVELYGATVTADGWVEVGGRDRLEITEQTPGLYDLASFNLGLTVERAAGAKGVLVHFPEVLVMRVDAAGYIRVTLETDDGSFELTSNAAVFGDELAHRINVVLDGASGLLSIIVDGVVDASMAASGLTSSQTYWGLTVGNTWGTALEAKVKDIYFGTEAAVPDEPELLVPEVILGSLKFRDGTVKATDIAYTLDNPDAYSDAGLDITKGNLVLTRDNGFIFDAERFGIAFDMATIEAGTSGVILFLYQTIELSLDASGELVLKLNTSEGWQQIETNGLAIGDGIAHRIAVEYDADSGLMQIAVDGTVVASGSQSGSTPPVKYWGLSFNQPWKDTEASVLIDNITITDEPTVEAPAPVATAGYAADAGAAHVALDFEGEVVADSSGNGAGISEVGEGVTLAHHADGSQFGEVIAGSGLLAAADQAGLSGLDGFLVTMALRSDAADGQQVLGLGGAMQLDVEGDDFVFHLSTSDGDFEVATDSDVLADRDWHEVAIAYSDSDGLLQIGVDGVTVQTVQASGTSAEAGGGLAIGMADALGFDGGIDEFAFYSGGDTQLYLLG